MSPAVPSLAQLRHKTPSLAPRSHNTRLYAIPVALCAALLLAFGITLVVLGRKGKLKGWTRRNHLNPYVRRLEEDMQIERVARVELERRNAEAAARAAGSAGGNENGRGTGGEEGGSREGGQENGQEGGREGGCEDVDVPELVQRSPGAASKGDSRPIHDVPELVTAAQSKGKNKTAPETDVPELVVKRT